MSQPDIRDGAYQDGYSDGFAYALGEGPGWGGVHGLSLPRREDYHTWAEHDDALEYYDGYSAGYVDGHLAGRRERS
jgi:hypothetical protein